MHQYLYYLVPYPFQILATVPQYIMRDTYPVNFKFNQIITMFTYASYFYKYLFSWVPTVLVMLFDDVVMPVRVKKNLGLVPASSIWKTVSRTSRYHFFKFTQVGSQLEGPSKRGRTFALCPGVPWHSLWYQS
ncbi:hypothetical protein QCA50_005604 [Cerrena zonata]|uniref:Uncharacterized protein n=1 Tax=Cerrena zonata TaxID=2478898 RepID=A0AAW0GC63_9APHY